jgi:hypothetical protein
MKKETKAKIAKREKRLAKREYLQRLNKFKELVCIRDSYQCQMCYRSLSETPKSRHVHHVIANTKKYKDLSTNPLNGVLLCPYHHKFSPDSPHQNAFYFIWWLKNNKLSQFEFLKAYLDTKNLIFSQ